MFPMAHATGVSVIRLPHAPPGRVTIRWNGKSIEAREGDSVAAALYANGIRLLARSRKRHRPQGLSGSFLGPVLGRVNGCPNVRLDLETVCPGLDTHIQNVWPAARFDLLPLVQLLPTRWLYAGFEHSNLIRNGTRLSRVWEYSLAYLAGMADPPDSVLINDRNPGRLLQTDVLVVGGGPAGCSAANEAVARGERVILITRGQTCGRSARLMAEPVPSLDPRVVLLAGMEVFGLYRGGRVAACAPPSHDRGAAVVETKLTVLATGRRSCPPLVRGNDLLGVLDTHAALALAGEHGVAPGRAVFVTGTGAQTRVAARLSTLGVNVVGTAPVDSIRRITGRKEVTSIETDRRTACDSVVHAGPWRRDPNLLFQAASEGSFHLNLGANPAEVQCVGAAAGPDEPVVVGPEPDETTLVCSCMDVTWDELARHVEKGETDVEVLKRLTACGMGPCQGTPCWDLMAAVLTELTGTPAEGFGRPSHRDPRRSITVGQAAGLDGLIEADR